MTTFTDPVIARGNGRLAAQITLLLGVISSVFALMSLAMAGFDRINACNDGCYLSAAQTGHAIRVSLIWVGISLGVTVVGAVGCYLTRARKATGA